MKKKKTLKIPWKKIIKTFKPEPVSVSDAVIAELKRKGLPLPVSAAFLECKKLKKIVDKS